MRECRCTGLMEWDAIYRNNNNIIISSSSLRQNSERRFVHNSLYLCNTHLDNYSYYCTVQPKPKHECMPYFRVIRICSTSNPFTSCKPDKFHSRLRRLGCVSVGIYPLCWLGGYSGPGFISGVMNVYDPESGVRSIISPASRADQPVATQ